MDAAARSSSQVRRSKRKLLPSGGIEGAAAGSAQVRRSKRKLLTAGQIDVLLPAGGIEGAAAGSAQVRRSKRKLLTAAQIDVLPAVGIEGAAAGSAQVRRSKRKLLTAAQIDVLLPAVGIGGADAGSASRRAKRRRTAQIGIPSRRAKALRPHHPLPRPLPNHPHPCGGGGVRPLDFDDYSPQDLDDDSNKPQPLLPLPDYDDDEEAKRASTVVDLPCHNWRDWSDLGDGPAGLIADRVLAYDVADYVRFRGVCRPWRQSSTEPRSHSDLDRRFHPWRWTMLREELAAPDRRSFLNTSTGQCVQVDIPELHDHLLLALTPEGLLVLLHKVQRALVHLLNPLTRHVTQLPPLTTLLPSEDHGKLLEDYVYFDEEFKAWGSGIANDDSTVVLCFNKLRMIGMAKPGDDSWTLLKYNRDGMTTAPLMFKGRYYCFNGSDVMVLEMGADQTPRLELAAKLSRRVSLMADSVHLVNNCGELMLVHRWCGPMTTRNKSGRGYNAYRVDLDTGTVIPVKSLGRNAVFMGMRSSLSVSLEAFPSGSISADTIYLSFDFGERRHFKVGAYHLIDGSIEHASRYWRGLVPRPHTLADCLSLSYSVEE